MPKTLLVITFLIVFIIVLSLVFFTRIENSSIPNIKTYPKLVESPPESLSNKASFVVFTKGTLRIFADPKYHNLSKDVYIDSENPNIIRVNKKDITYGDFFQTLPMKLTNTCLTTGTGQEFCDGENGILQFYLNGEKIENFQNRKIRNGDKALITFGTQEKTAIDKQIEILNSL